MLSDYFNTLNNYLLAVSLIYQQLIAALMQEYPGGNYPGM